MLLRKTAACEDDTPLMYNVFDGMRPTWFNEVVGVGAVLWTPPYTGNALARGVMREKDVLLHRSDPE